MRRGGPAVAGMVAMAVLAAVAGTPAVLAVLSDAPAVGANSFSTATRFGRMTTGSYTGDGVDNRSITGLGFQPDVVIVKGAGGSTAVIRTSTMVGDATKPMQGATGLQTNRVKTLAADGFTLGTQAQVNSSGTVYYWAAFKAFAARLAVGSYVGTGTSRSITGLGFSPEYVVVMSAQANSALHRSSIMSSAVRFDGTAAGADGLNSLDPDGFSVGTHAQANGNGVTYHWVAWNAAAGSMGVGSYTGNGVDSRSITGIGFQAQYVVVKSGASGAPVHRPASLSGDSTLLYGSANAANLIQALEVDGFQVGTDGQVNTNGTTYYYVAFRDP